MPTLFGRDLAKDDLLNLAGDLSQVAGIRMMTLADGVENGVRIADIRTGSGLRFQVTLDRGMDISVAEYRGVPLSYRSPAGDVHPSRFEPAGRGWLRTFPGGLMTGCGMTNAGAPCSDAGQELGLHGRLSHLQASGVAASERWEGDECVLRLSGSVTETAMFGATLVLTRTIEAVVGRSTITIRDDVRNAGHEKSPLMMLYHINAGWPLLAPGARLLLGDCTTAPRDPAAAAGLAHFRECTPPEHGYAEQVFYHDCRPDAGGYCAALLQNDDLALGLLVRFRHRELPRLAQWKMMGEGTYVLGIEPANCATAGREAERRAGTLQFLDPGELRSFEVEIRVLDGKEEIASVVERHRLS